jgi:hypothetical protein
MVTSMNCQHALSKLISEEVLLLQTELKKEYEDNTNLAMYDSDVEWDDVYDTSEIPNADDLELAGDLSRNGLSSLEISNDDSQSDSGISEHEVQNSSKYPRTLLNDSRSAFFVGALSNDQAENSSKRSSFRNSYHG